MPAKTEDTAAGHAAAVEALRDVPQIPGASKPDPILVVDHVSRQFGGHKAVDVAHVEVQRGAITALIGPNGAGKTTLFNLLTGFDKPDGGTWTFNDQSVAGLAPYRLARMGMVRTFQPDVTFFVYTILLLGGAARVFGPIVGSIIFWFLLAGFGELLYALINNGHIDFLAAQQVGSMRFMLMGLGLMLLMIFRPQGIFGDRRELALDAR